MKLKDANILTYTQLANIMGKLNGERAPQDRTIILNENCEAESSRMLGFTITKSPNVPVGEYQVWINGVQYIC